ncbi:MAG TPA: HAD-IA family hydrolase [Thermoanaerobaculia bacterium]|nr:HAD-IA family hydrolase [Thermoanaerobaculia bacterium]
MPIQAVTFDVTHTLIHSPRLGEIYAEVLVRHGIRTTAEEAGGLVRRVWQEFACAADPGHDRFRAHADGARGFWQRFLARMAEHLEVPTPSRFAAAELYHRFSTPEAWEVYPEVPGVLAALREQGLRLAVISNWDERLPELLARLELAPFFDVLVYSSEVGVEKPDRRIFAEALRRLGVEPRATLHVGDSPLEDVEGAIAAGMEAVRLERSGRRGGIPDLSDLPRRLKTPPYGRKTRRGTGSA